MTGLPHHAALKVALPHAVAAPPCVHPRDDRGPTDRSVEYVDLVDRRLTS